MSGCSLLTKADIGPFQTDWLNRYDATSSLAVSFDHFALISMA